MADVSIKTNLMGIVMDNPMMPGSGPLSGDDERLKELADLGIGGLVTKTIAPAAAKVARPCIVKKDNIIMNCEGWSEHAGEKWTEEFIPNTYGKVSQPIIASVGYSPEEYAEIIPKIDKYVKGYECVARFHNNSGDYTEVGECVKAFRSLTDKPFWVKMSGNKPDPVAFSRTCLENGASGVVAITSLGPCLAVDIRNRRPLIGLGSGFSWASGPAIKPLALSTVFTLKQALPEISIIGSGGIATAEDVIEFLLAGADAVEMLSTAMMRGKSAYSKIIADLPAKLAEYGFKDIEDVKKKRISAREPRFTPEYPVISAACTGCGLCSRNCPYSAMFIENGKAKVDVSKCFGCGLCQSACPAKAISGVLK